LVERHESECEMIEMPASSKTLRRQLADLLTAVMVTSAKIDAQERAEKLETSVEVATGIRPSDELRKVEQFIRSAAYQHALKAYVDGAITLSDLARALDPLRPMLPWLVRTVMK
jgi:hypothetical protein